MAKRTRARKRPPERRPFSERWRAKTFTGQIGKRAKVEEESARGALLGDPLLPRGWALLGRAAPVIDRVATLVFGAFAGLAYLAAVLWISESPFEAALGIFMGSLGLAFLADFYRKHRVEKALLARVRRALADARARAEARAEAERAAEAALAAELAAPLAGAELSSATVDGSSTSVAIPLRVHASSE